MRESNLTPARQHETSKLPPDAGMLCSLGKTPIINNLTSSNLCTPSEGLTNIRDDILGEISPTSIFGFLTSPELEAKGNVSHELVNTFSPEAKVVNDPQMSNSLKIQNSEFETLQRVHYNNILKHDTCNASPSKIEEDGCVLFTPSSTQSKLDAETECTKSDDVPREPTTHSSLAQCPRPRYGQHEIKKVAISSEKCLEDKSSVQKRPARRATFKWMRVLHEGVIKRISIPVEDLGSAEAALYNQNLADALRSAFNLPKNQRVVGLSLFDPLHAKSNENFIVPMGFLALDCLASLCNFNALGQKFAENDFEGLIFVLLTQPCEEEIADDCADFLHSQQISDNAIFQGSSSKISQDTPLSLQDASEIHDESYMADAEHLRLCIPVHEVRSYMSCFVRWHLQKKNISLLHGTVLLQHIRIKEEGDAFPELDQDEFLKCDANSSSAGFDTVLKAAYLVDQWLGDPSYLLPLLVNFAKEMVFENAFENCTGGVYKDDVIDGSYNSDFHLTVSDLSELITIADLLVLSNQLPTNKYISLLDSILNRDKNILHTLSGNRSQTINLCRQLPKWDSINIKKAAVAAYKNLMQDIKEIGESLELLDRESDQYYLPDGAASICSESSESVPFSLSENSESNDNEGVDRNCNYLEGDKRESASEYDEESEVLQCRNEPFAGKSDALVTGIAILTNQKGISLQQALSISALFNRKPWLTWYFHSLCASCGDTELYLNMLAHFAQEADHYILEHGSILITDRDRCLFPLSDVDDAAYRRMYSRNIKMVLQTMCFLLEESMIDYHDVSNLIIAIGCGKSPLFYLAEELVESDNYDIFLANFIDAAKNGLGEIPSTISDHIGSAYDATSTILQRWKLRFQEKIGLRHAIAADDPILRLATEKYLGGDFNDEDFYRLLWPLFRQPQHSPELVFRHLTGR